MKKILVAIPAYNCEVQIRRVLKRLHSIQPQYGFKTIVIENRSPRDNTLQSAIEEAKDLQMKNIEVLQNNENWGLGGSHKVAINFAIENGFDYVCFVHGDDQTNGKQLAELIDISIKDESLEAVLGTRFMKGSTLHGYNKLRELANVGLNWLFTLLSFRRTYELGAGLSVHKVETFKDRNYLKFTDDFNFYSYMLLDYYKKNSKILNTPIEYYETDQISNVGNFHIGMITLTCVLKWRLGLLKNFYKQGAYSFTSSYKKD